jgi:hypothetical protein
VRPGRLYLDTSAYLGILLREERAASLPGTMAGAELLSSVLLVLEARRNLIRLAREGSLSPEAYEACISQVTDDIAKFELRDLTLDLCGVRSRRWRRPARTTSRTCARPSGSTSSVP